MTNWGAELGDGQDQLCVMLNKPLPGAIINELLDHPVVDDYNSMLALCARRTGHKKEQELCDHLRNHTMGATRMNMMRSENAELHQ